MWEFQDGNESWQTILTSPLQSECFQSAIISCCFVWQKYRFRDENPHADLKVEVYAQGLINPHVGPGAEIPRNISPNPFRPEATDQILIHWNTTGPSRINYSCMTLMCCEQRKKLLDVLPQLISYWCFVTACHVWSRWRTDRSIHRACLWHDRCVTSLDENEMGWLDRTWTWENALNFLFCLLLILKKQFNQNENPAIMFSPSCRW